MMQATTKHSSMDILELDQGSANYDPQANSRLLSVFCMSHKLKMVSHLYIIAKQKSQKKNNISMECCTTCHVLFYIFGYVSTFNLYNNPVNWVLLTILQIRKMKFLNNSSIVKIVLLLRSLAGI